LPSGPSFSEKIKPSKIKTAPAVIKKKLKEFILSFYPIGGAQTMEQRTDVRRPFSALWLFTRDFCLCDKK
jgi:hypothetical protein